MTMLSRGSNAKAGFSFITHQIGGRFTATQPSDPRVALGYVTSTIQIGVDTMPTSITLENSTIPPSVQAVTSVTLFAGVSGIDVNHPNTLNSGFILQKFLKFPESPLVHPSVMFSSLPNIGQILHHQYISFGKFLDDLFRDVVVYPNHKPFPPTAILFKFSSSGPCAFGLEFCHKSLPFNPFPLHASKKVCFAGDRQVVYSEVNAQNFTVMVVVIARFCIDLFGEDETEEKSVFEVFGKGTFPDLPAKILLKIFRKFYRKLGSSVHRGQRKKCPVSFYGSASWEIVSDGEFFGNFGFGFCSLNHFQCLFDSVNSELRLKSKPFPDLVIAKFMEAVSFLNFIGPSFLNTELYSFRKYFHCLVKEPRKINDFNLRSNNNLHILNFIKGVV